jgi:transglutaminase-like putative cysteine protease
MIAAMRALGIAARFLAGCVHVPARSDSRGMTAGVDVTEAQP